VAISPEYIEDHLAFVRRCYQVPAFLGVRVRVFDGREGAIVSCCGTYVHVLIDGDEEEAPYHPTWKITYLLDDQRPISAELQRRHAEQETNKLD
jgi:hypothetical protein